MSKYLKITPLFLILCLSIIIFISGKLAPQYNIDNNTIPSLENEYKHCESNNEHNPKHFFPENNNEENFIQLNYSINKIEYTDEISKYILDLKEIREDEKNGKDLLIYTNFTEEAIYYYFDNQNNYENISTFEIIENNKLHDKDNLTIVINSKKRKGIGFIDFSFENQGLFKVNKNITREDFYKQSINLEKSKNDSKYYINLIPTDNNSEVYFIQLNFSILKKEKDKLNLYYLNNVNQESIKEVIEALKNKPLKRDKKINGKIEIFAYNYSGLEEDGTLTLAYNRIKGEGIAGFITSISVLFFILIIIVIIFLKNTYS